jgi:uncharacterized secreted protein with C-terminal beta-propeller domain
LTGGKIEYQNSGEFGGRFLDKLSMNKKGDNFFVIAVIDQDPIISKNQQKKIASVFYSLDENLKVLGRLEITTEKEKMFPIQFTGNRAYIRKSKKPNSFFAIDISAPQGLKALGEMTAPEFSNYVYLNNNNLLIAFNKLVGDSNSNDLKNQGLNLSLFDISDIQSPIKIDSQILGGKKSSSVAVNDHDAFFFSKEKKILIIPISIKNSEGGIFGNQDFDGAIVFNVTNQGFLLNGLIDHGDMVFHLNNELVPSKFIKKSFLFDDIIYSLSDRGMKLSSVKGLNTLKTFSLLSIIEKVEDDYLIHNY